MKKICLFFVLIAMVVLIFPGNGRATTMTNPNPALFAEDDGSQLFIPNSSVFSVEYFDLGGSVGYFSAFGFYYASDPSTPIAIFGTQDQGVSGSQVAKIDFAAGTVYDLDNSTVQSTFTNAPGTSIGFFLHIDDDPSTPATFLRLHTESSLNSGGLDAAGTFPVLADPTAYGISFIYPQLGTFLSFHVVGGGGGITPVPEPSTLLLLGSGLAGLAAAYGKKRFRKKV